MRVDIAVPFDFVFASKYSRKECHSRIEFVSICSIQAEERGRAKGKTIVANAAAMVALVKGRRARLLFGAQCLKPNTSPFHHRKKW